MRLHCVGSNTIILTVCDSIEWLCSGVFLLPLISCFSCSDSIPIIVIMASQWYTGLITHTFAVVCELLHTSLAWCHRLKRTTMGCFAPERWDRPRKALSPFGWSTVIHWIIYVTPAGPLDSSETELQRIQLGNLEATGQLRNHWGSRSNERREIKWHKIRKEMKEQGNGMHIHTWMCWLCVRLPSYRCSTARTHTLTYTYKLAYKYALARPSSVIHTHFQWHSQTSENTL